MGPQSAIQLVKVSLWFAARFGGSGQAPPDRCGPASGRHDRVGRSPDHRAPRALASSTNSRPAKTVRYRLILVCGPVDLPRPPELCVLDHTTPLQVRGMEVTLSEDMLPAVTPPGGTLLTGGPQHGVRTVSYAASDPQSGLAKVEVLLGDTVVKSHDLAPRCFLLGLHGVPRRQTTERWRSTRVRSPTARTTWRFVSRTPLGTSRSCTGNARSRSPMRHRRRRRTLFSTRSPRTSRARHDGRSPCPTAGASRCAAVSRRDPRRRLQASRSRFSSGLTGAARARS